MHMHGAHVHAHWQSIVYCSHELVRARTVNVLCTIAPPSNVNISAGHMSGCDLPDCKPKKLSLQQNNQYMKQWCRCQYCAYAGGQVLDIYDADRPLCNALLRVHAPSFAPMLTRSDQPIAKLCRCPAHWVVFVELTNT